MNVIAYLKKPYPLGLRRWPLILSISLFITFFMLLFQPFGLQHLVMEHKTELLAGYGLVTFLVLVFNLILLPLVHPSTFIEDRWTILKQIVWLNWIVISISAGNYAYSTLFSITHWISFQGFLIFLGFTFSIGIIPISIITILTHNRLLKKNLESSSSLNRKMSDMPLPFGGLDADLIFKSDTAKQEIPLKLSDLIYIESDGNYVEIWFLKDGKPHGEVLRNTLKNIESQLPEKSSLFKCHRAFIINIAHIHSVKGNSQGYRAKLKSVEKEIPVARASTRDFKTALENL